MITFGEKNQLIGIRLKARKDWENEEAEAVGDFETYFAGYLACLKRFCTKPTKREDWDVYKHGTGPLMGDY